MKIGIVNACIADKHYFQSCAHLITTCFELMKFTLPVKTVPEIARIDRSTLEWDLHSPKFDTRTRKLKKLGCSCLVAPDLRRFKQAGRRSTEQQRDQTPLDTYEQSQDSYRSLLDQIKVFFIVGDNHATPWHAEMKPINCLIRRCIRNKTHAFLISDCAFESLVFVVTSGLAKNVIVKNPFDSKNMFLESVLRKPCGPLSLSSTSDCLQEILLDPIEGVLYAPQQNHDGVLRWSRFAHTGLKNYEPLIAESPDASSFAINIYKSSVSRLKNEHLCSFQKDHFLFDEIQGSQFQVEQRSKWQITKHPDPKLVRLARTDKAICILQYDNIVAIHFVLADKYRSSLLILKNFVKECLNKLTLKKPLALEKVKNGNFFDTESMQSSEDLEAPDKFNCNRIYNKSGQLKSIVQRFQAQTATSNSRSKKSIRYEKTEGMNESVGLRRLGFFGNRENSEEVEATKISAEESNMFPSRKITETSPDSKQRSQGILNPRDSSFWNAPVIDCRARKICHSKVINDMTKQKPIDLEAKRAVAKNSICLVNNQNDIRQFKRKSVKWASSENRKEESKIGRKQQDRPLLMKEKLYRYRYREQTPERWTGTRNFKAY